MTKMKTNALVDFVLNVIKHHGYSGEKQLQNFINISSEELRRLIEQLVRIGSLDKNLIDHARKTGITVQPIIG